MGGDDRHKDILQDMEKRKKGPADVENLEVAGSMLARRGKKRLPATNYKGSRGKMCQNYYPAVGDTERKGSPECEWVWCDLRGG